MKRSSSLILMSHTFPSMTNSSRAYIGSYPDDYLLRSLLKDGDLPMTARSSTYTGLALTATPNESTSYTGLALTVRANQQPTRVLP